MMLCLRGQHKWVYSEIEEWDMQGSFTTIELYSHRKCSECDIEESLERVKRGWFDLKQIWRRVK